MTFPTRSKQDKLKHIKAGRASARKKNTGKYAYAKLGKTESYRPVHVIDISNNGIAHISWQGSGGVVDGHISTKYLKYKNT
jgi:hypothetical protein